jgi:hypothetical protein
VSVINSHFIGEETEALICFLFLLCQALCLYNLIPSLQQLLCYTCSSSIHSFEKCQKFSTVMSSEPNRQPTLCIHGAYVGMGYSSLIDKKARAERG